MGTNFWPGLFALLATWWVHSTLLLGTVALVSMFLKEMPPRWREWLWKTAVVLPWLTMPAQYAWQGSCTLWQWELSPMTIPATQSQPASPEVLADRKMEPHRDAILDPAPSKANGPDQLSGTKEILPVASTPAIAEKPWETSILIEENYTNTAIPSFTPTDLPEVSPWPGPMMSRAVSDERHPESSTPRPMPPVESPRSEPMPARVSWPWFVPAVVGAVLTFAALGSCRFAWRLISTWRLIRRSRKLTSGTAHKELQRLLAGCEKRIQVELVESGQAATPAAGGLFRRVILLPANVEQRLSREELRALLAHELAHHARGDVRWLWFGRAMCHVLPVQPLYFLAVRQWHLAAEPLCDDWAIARNISPITLAKSLTNVAEWCLARPAVGPAATGGPTQLTYRVERLLNLDPASKSPGSRGWLVPLILLLAGSILVLAPLVRLGQADSPETKPESASDTDQPILISTVSSNSQPNETGPAGQAVPDNASHAIPRDILEDLKATTSDLNRAILLLQATEEDPELLEAITKLRERLNSIQASWNKRNPN